MDDQTCPRCKTTNYRNPSLKLLVNVCGHSLCEACVDMLFSKGSGACPQCMVPLRRANFRVQLFENAAVEKDVDIRRRIMRDYNLQQDDFDTVRAYNDYLEEIEDIIYNLSNNIDIIETNKRIEQFKKDHREQIQRNRKRKSRSQQEYMEILEAERAQQEAREQELQEFELEQKKKKEEKKISIIERLIAGKENVKEVVKQMSQEAEKLREEQKTLPPPKPITEFSSGIKFGMDADMHFKPVPKEEEGALYTYTAQNIPGKGKLLALLDVQTTYQARIKQFAIPPHLIGGGFKPESQLLRTLQMSRQGLYDFPEVDEIQ